MRTRIVIAAMAASLALASAAYAAPASGTVESYDPAKRILVLNRGQMFEVSRNIRNPEFKVGDNVEITWSNINKYNGIRVAKTVKPARTPANRILLGN